MAGCTISQLAFTIAMEIIISVFCRVVGGKCLKNGLYKSGLVLGFPFLTHFFKMSIFLVKLDFF